jgi:hypothetical protein
MSKHKKSKKKKTSQKQIEANRRNAERSTGPTSDEGKEISSRNARNEDYYTKQLLADESEDEFLLFYNGLDEEFAPSSETEICYFEEFAWSVWLIRRIRRQMNRVWQEFSDVVEQNRELDRLSKIQQRLERSREKARREFYATRSGLVNPTPKQLTRARIEEFCRPPYADMNASQFYEEVLGIPRKDHMGQVIPPQNGGQMGSFCAPPDPSASTP